MKIPRDVSGISLVKVLISLGYTVSRQKGSHIRMTKLIGGEEHHLTIPHHSPLKIGTLNSICKEIAEKLKITKEEIFSKL